MPINLDKDYRRTQFALAIWNVPRRRMKRIRNVLTALFFAIGLPVGVRGQQSADDYAKQAFQEYQASDWDAAISHYNHAIQLDPKFAPYYLNRGVTKQAKGDLDGALIDFNKALDLDVTFARAYVCRGNIKKVKRDLGGALTDYDRAIEFDPKFSKAYSYRAIFKKATGDPSGSLVDFNRAIELAPKDGTTFNNRGDLKRFTGDLAGALSDFDEATKLEPKLGNAYFGRGLVKLAKGDVDGALTDFNKTVEIEPKNAAVQFNIGLGREAKQDWDGALIAFRRALELNSTAQDYTRFRIWIVRMKKGDLAAANDELSTYLVKRTTRTSGDWTEKIARYLLGQISEDDLLGASASLDSEVSAGQHCEFWFYVGMKQLLVGDKQTASNDFRKCLATQKRDFAEFWSAQIELKALAKSMENP
ncbi:MAG TPA: tetratricopeptide repeat protein [Verrucomicrobiae bacterium]